MWQLKQQSSCGQVEAQQKLTRRSERCDSSTGRTACVTPRQARLDYLLVAATSDQPLFKKIHYKISTCLLYYLPRLLLSCGLSHRHLLRCDARYPITTVASGGYALRLDVTSPLCGGNVNQLTSESASRTHYWVKRSLETLGNENCFGSHICASPESQIHGDQYHQEVWAEDGHRH